MFRKALMVLVAGLLAACAHGPAPDAGLAATGDLGVIIERADGSVQIVRHGARPESLARITGLGDLSHATVAFSRDQRWAYVFGRDGGLTRIDIPNQRIDKRIIQGGNSIGGAISQDGSLIAVGNYEPGGVRVFDAATLEQVADVAGTPIAPDPEHPEQRFSRTVGVADAPGQQFVFSLFDTGEIWRLDLADRAQPLLHKYTGIGQQPYDGMITADGRYYLAGLFGEDGLAQLDLWHPERGVKRVLGDYGRHGERLPVYKMPHLEGWAAAGDKTLVPGVGEHRVLALDNRDWTQVGSVDVLGQPVFIVMRPDARQAWVNFALPDNDKVQVIDLETLSVTHTLEPGPGVLHMEFTPKGEQVWLSVRDRDEVQVWDPYAMKRIASLPAQAPSGIFFTHRAYRMGL